MTARPTILCVVISLLGMLAVSESRAGDLYALDQDHTSIAFGVTHADLSFVYGFFRKSRGGYILDRGNPAASRFEFEVDVDSIFTNQEDRDKELLSELFFDASRFPRMTFKSTSCTQTSARDGSIVYNVVGDMTIHGVVKRQVVLPLRLMADKEGARKDRRTGFLCQFEVKRSDYGMKAVPFVGDSVGVTISFEGVYKGPAESTASR